MKRLKMLICLFVFLLIFCVNINNIYAARYNYSFIASSISFDGKINLPVGESTQAGVAESVAYFDLKVNGKTAYCADPYKRYQFGQGYTYKFDIDGFIGKIYTWAEATDNRKTAQVLIWALTRSRLGNMSDYSGGSIVRMDIDVNTFVRETRNYYSLLSENNSRIDYKWILKNAEYCKCAFNKRCDPIYTRGNSSNNTPDYGFEFLDDGTVKYYQEDSTKVYTYSKKNSEGKIDGLTLDDCYSIANKTTVSEKIKEYRRITYNYTDIIGERGVDDALTILYNQINGYETKRLSYYVPDDDDTVQPVIAPGPTELDPKSCSNYVSTMTDNGASQDEIIAYLKQQHVNYKLSEETGKILCYDKNNVCAEGKRKYILLKKIGNPNFSPKIGNRWLYIYTPDPSTQNPEAPTCECWDQANKYNKQAAGSQYQLNCEEFKKWYYDNIDPYAKNHLVMYCDEEKPRAERASCTPDGPGSHTCDELLQNNTYRSYSCSDISDNYITCKEENGKITKLVCETKCGPQITPAICPGKDSQGGETILQMSDAIDTNGNPDYQYCVKQGIGYQIDSESVSSVEAIVENDKKEVYCNIRCWESLSLQYPAEPQPTGYLSPIEAGRKFWWGVQYDSVFARLYTKRVCWADEINYKFFENDWASNEDNIKQKYAEYMAEVNYNKQTDVKKGEECCVGNKTHKVQGTSCDSPYYYSGGKCIHNKKAGEGCHPGATEINATTCEGPSPGERDECDDDAKGHNYYLDEASYTYDGKTGKSNQVKKCAVSAPDASELYDSNEEAKRKSAVEAAIKNRVTIYNRILSCQSTSKINEKSMYSYGTEITLVDNNDINLAGKKVKTLTLKSNPYGSVSVEGNEQAGVSQWLTCNTLPSGFSMNSGDPCEGKTGYNIPTYLQYKWTYEGGSNFTYTNEFHFVAKMDSDTVISIEHLDANEVTAHSLGLDYDMGTGIPTYIDKATGKFNIDIDVKNLGSMKEGKAHFTPLVEKSEDLYDYNAKDYACQYDLGNYICPPPCGGGGLAIEYRLIEMASGDTKKIFPGKDGKGRNQGSNWASFIATNATKYKNITSIGVVYKKPMYSIELTPTTIGKIRESNKKYKDSKKDPYTSYKDENNNYKIHCLVGLNDQQVAQQTCTSSYITKLIKEKVITGEYAIENEDNRRNKLKNYKSCYINNTNC